MVEAYWSVRVGSFPGCVANDILVLSFTNLLLPHLKLLSDQHLARAMRQTGTLTTQNENSSPFFHRKTIQRGKLIVELRCAQPLVSANGQLENSKTRKLAIGHSPLTIIYCILSTTVRTCFEVIEGGKGGVLVGGRQKFCKVVSLANVG